MVATGSPTSSCAYKTCQIMPGNRNLLRGVLYVIHSCSPGLRWSNQRLRLHLRFLRDLKSSPCPSHATGKGGKHAASAFNMSQLATLTCDDGPEHQGRCKLILPVPKHSRSSSPECQKSDTSTNTSKQSANAAAQSHIREKAGLLVELQIDMTWE